MDSNDSRSSSSSINLLNAEQTLNADSLEHDLMYKKFQSLDCDQEFENAVRKCENNENINTNFLDQKPLSPDILSSGQKAENMALPIENKKTELFLASSTLNETLTKSGKKPRKNKKSTLKLNQSLNNSNSSNENDPNSSSTCTFFFLLHLASRTFPNF